ncbi:iron-containing alcohol dehydrogenase [Clostridium sp. BNL1100]|uniref:iron-containing alcohol dehydrogenase n=1 Tax=Clostridium sp. BNL1100 TaxID=755731 RepID=UPI00024A7D53|nr:iron-containing alcohol dehydrogenase [Clostridium sp. BNL1100]AEY68030.1 Fe-dependent oxidoreductase, alcohol dehydrogenase [Clostridium sp. BNL1100]
MLNFDMHLPTRIVFGKDTQKMIGSLIKPYTQKALLHYGGNSIKKSGLYDQVVASLKENNIEFVELGGVVPNPRLSLAEEGAELCKKEGVDLILAVGGGSVIDSAKAIALGACNDDIWKFYEEGGEIKAALTVATILTIPAAGSESSPHTVITNEEKQIKKGYGSNYLKPVLSIVNPELFFTLPKNQIANGVADMMSHIFERYFTNTTHTDLTDGLCETTLKTIMKNALIVSQNPENYDAWCQVGFGGTIAHNDILGLGRAQDWACHDMEHELSAIYDIAHGAGLAILTPAWMQYVYKTNINMFVQFAVNVMGVEGSYRDPDAIVMEGIARLREFYKKMGLPATLTEIGIEESKYELMAQKATGEAYGREHSIGGLKKLYWQDVLEIYKLAK